MTQAQGAKKAILEVRNVQGHVVAKAPISGEFEANLRDATTDAPLAGREIVFRSSTTHREIGRATTDARGIARYDSGSRLAQPLLVGDVTATGVVAAFEGDAEYAPVEDRAGTSIGA
ncbi:hypothetical protein [Embleya sp. NPDC001921]